MPTADAERIARLGAVLASPSRAAILSALMGGTAHTHVELGRHTGLAASSMSEHVGVLIDAGLVTVDAQGRHRYVRLADRGVAELIEQIGALAGTGGVPTAERPRVPAALAFARSCYGHLAGEVGVRVHDALVADGALVDDDGSLTLTHEGRARFERLGVTVPAGGRALARPCLDWSQRRHHLAGRAGDALLTWFLAEGWLRRHPTQPRALQLGADGRRSFATRLGVVLP